MKGNPPNDTLPYLGGRSSRSSRISIPLKTTLCSEFTYGVRLLCLC